MRWVVAQGFRAGRDQAWDLAFRNREFRTPPVRLDPGEFPDGTWPAHMLYEAPPTAPQMCEFAAVEFLGRHDDRPRTGQAARVWEGAFVRDAWVTVTGHPPPCDFRD